MAIIEQKYLKIYKGGMAGASVQLEIIPNNLGTNRIIVESEKIPFRSQGFIEGGHENWNKSARKALEIAQAKLNISPTLDMKIKKLEGRMFIETNNASIGVACILALWKYLDIQPEDTMMDKIHQFAREDWKNEVEFIPDFESIFEK